MILRKLFCRAFLLLSIPLFLAGCASPQTKADKLAGPVGLVRDQVKAGSFLLTFWRRMKAPGEPVTVYIEGDGLAWLSKWEPSSDPSPHRALALNLAVVDPSPNVVYLARPCQFTPKEMDPHCRVAYWTDLRFSKDVIDSMDKAITYVAGRGQGRRLHLVGYSGGGAVAALIAAQRDDVATLRTVAGNLDHVEVNRIHDVTQMPDSRNPIDIAPQLAALPQIHFSGADDEIVPPSIAVRFQKASGGGCVQTRRVQGVSHEEGWVERWPRLLKEKPVCLPDENEAPGYK